MIKDLKARYLRQAISLVIVAWSLGTTGVTYLKAETISCITSIEANSIKIKDTTVTFGEAVPGPKGQTVF